MRKGRLTVLLVVLMAAMLAVSACGKKTSPKEAMQNAWAASMKMKSFAFDGSFVIDELALPSGAQAADLPFAELIRNASLAVSGAYVQNPLRMEMDLKLALPGDLALTVDVPVIFTEDKVYVRIPDIPMLPLGDAAGKFVELDPAGLTEEDGGTLPAVDVELQRKLSGEVLGILFRSLDEKIYFQELKKDDVSGLPGDLKADRYVKFSVTPENFDAFMQTLADQVLPALVDLLLENEEYRSMLRITEDELKRAKEEIASNGPESLRNSLEELKKNLKVNEISLTGALKGDHLVYQKLKGNVEATENGETTKIGFTFDIRYDKINEDVTFKHDIPADALTMEEFRRSLFPGLAF
jgi:hypothetical protein